MPIYNSAPKKDDDGWDQIVWRQEVLGDCHSCGKRETYALWTVYGNREEIIRCLSCQTAGQFEIHDEAYYKKASSFKPFKSGDEDYYRRSDFGTDFENRTKRGSTKRGSFDSNE